MSDYHAEPYYYDDDEETFIGIELEEGFELKLMLWAVIAGIFLSMIALAVLIIGHTIEMIRR